MFPHVQFDQVQTAHVKEHLASEFVNYDCIILDAL
jgi:hypothetical protein